MVRLEMALEAYPAGEIPEAGEDPVEDVAAGAGWGEAAGAGA